MGGAITAFGGAAVVSRLFRGMSLTYACDSSLGFLRKISLGYTAGQMVESIATGLLLGIDCVEDMDRLRDDLDLDKLLGYQSPSTRCVRDWLEKFHDEELVLFASETAEKLNLKASIPESSKALRSLQEVLGISARSAASRHPEGAPLSATVDFDGSIIESHKVTAKVAYEGTRGYQPLTAIWAEADVILATEFRDGNVPGNMAPLACVKQAFSELPKGIKHFAFRGDSANDNNELLKWLDDFNRDGGPHGVVIEYAISARMVKELAEAAKKVPDAEWITIPSENDQADTLSQWTELDYVPGLSYEHKDALPRRYIGIRHIERDTRGAFQ